MLYRTKEIYRNNEMKFDILVYILKILCFLTALQLLTV